MFQSSLSMIFHHLPQSLSHFPSFSSWTMAISDHFGLRCHPGAGWSSVKGSKVWIEGVLWRNGGFRLGKWGYPNSWMVDFGNIPIQKGWWLGVALWLRKPPNGKLKAGTNQWTHFSGLSETSPRLIQETYIKKQWDTGFQWIIFLRGKWASPSVILLRLPQVQRTASDGVGSHNGPHFGYMAMNNLVKHGHMALNDLIQAYYNVKWCQTRLNILLHGHRKNICKAKGLEVEGECSAMSKRWSNINISFHYFSLPKKTWFDSEMLATCPTNIYQLHQPLSPLAAASSSLVPANWRLQMQLVFELGSFLSFIGLVYGKIYKKP